MIDESTAPVLIGATGATRRRAGSWRRSRRESQFCSAPVRMSAGISFANALPIARPR
jgi:hypothetical protein